MIDELSHPCERSTPVDDSRSAANTYVVTARSSPRPAPKISFQCLFVTSYNVPLAMRLILRADLERVQ